MSVPPCAIMPFRGFISYAAPVCFMYEAPEPVRASHTPFTTPMHCMHLIAEQPGSILTYSSPRCLLQVYFVTRALWCKVWCKLNAIRSSPGHLLHLCKTFEDLLLRHHPRLFFHLLRCGVNPLQAREHLPP